MQSLQFRRLPTLAALLMGTLLASGMPSQVLQAEDDTKPSVSLTIDFGDGSQLRFTRLPWSDKMTALDALTASAKHDRGVKAKVRSSGSFAFVTEIDGQANEGGNGRNWIFKVNGKLGKVGAGVQKLESGDQVQWLFDRYDK